MAGVEGYQAAFHQKDDLAYATNGCNDGCGVGHGVIAGFPGYCAAGFIKRQHRFSRSPSRNI